MYVRFMPDVGLRCAFTPELTEVFRGYQEGSAVVVGRNHPSHSAVLADGPQRGDVIVQLAGQEVKTWPGLLRTLNELGTAKPLPVKNLDEPQARRAAYALMRDQPLVYVEFERPQNDLETPLRFGCWFRLGRLPLEELVPSVLWLLLKLGLFCVGALVFWKRPADGAAAQFFLLSIVTVGAYMGGYHWARIASEPLLLLIFMSCAVLLPVVTLHFYLIFPRPKAFVRAHPLGTLAAVYGVPGVFLLGMAMSYIHLRTLVRGGAPHETVAAAWELLRGEIIVYLVIAAVGYLSSVASLLHSFRYAADVTERNQVKWILFGALGALVPIGYTLYLVFWEQEAFRAGHGTWPMFAASVCFTVAFAVSITRYRLMQLDQLISSGAVYFVVSVFAGLAYYGVVFAGMLAANLLGAQVIAGSLLSQSLWVSTTALVLLLTLNLARGRLHKALDRRFYRDKHQLDRTLRKMGQAIEQLVDPPALARRFLQTSIEILDVSWGAVYLRDSDAAIYRLTESVGPALLPLTELSPGCPVVEALRRRPAVTGLRDEPDEGARRQLRFLGAEVAAALAHEGDLLAFVVLGPKERGLYSVDDLNLLAAFGQLTALALENARGHCTIEALNEDLQEKVEKISEQQRRILALQKQLTRLPGGRDAAPAAGVNSDSAPPDERNSDSFARLIGSGSALRQVVDLARKVAPAPSAVLIRGESGTGKELLARALHQHSNRADKPYVAVQCGALAAGVLESELFGHVKGAFTSAHRDKMGRFELANGGTIFLDEIGDVSVEVQSKLLRVIQEKTFERVGSSEAIRVDVRVIAATHRDLEELCRRGGFRTDLYYRLNVIELALPPLRDRREDIPELVLHFLAVCADRAGKPIPQVDDDALVLLKAYDWPGNVRELENVVERAMAIAEGPIVSWSSLPRSVRDGALLPESGEPDPSGAPSEPPLMAGSGVRLEREERGRQERQRLVRALAMANGNKAEAARALGLARSTLVSRLKKHGLT
jgi:transcriptional regulator with GAF, ATPase, and Fis domain